MVKTNLTVEDFEDKKYGANKRYTRFKTDQGWMGCFDKQTIDKLKDSEGECVSVEVLTDNSDRQKITKFYGKATANEVKEYDDMENPEVIKPGNVVRKSVKGSAYEKDPVGLAVDVFCAVRISSTGTDDAKYDMKYCISLVKEAQKAFQ